MYLIKELTQASLPEIGRMFAGKHHTTVLHSDSEDRQAAPAGCGFEQVDSQLNRINPLSLLVSSTVGVMKILFTAVEDSARSPEHAQSAHLIPHNFG